MRDIERIEQIRSAYSPKQDGVRPSDSSGDVLFLLSQLDHWRANHADVTNRAALLSQRTDLSVDRLPAYRVMERLQAELAKVRSWGATQRQEGRRDQHETHLALLGENLNLHDQIRALKAGNTKTAGEPAVAVLARLECPYNEQQHGQQWHVSAHAWTEAIISAIRALRAAATEHT